MAQNLSFLIITHTVFNLEIHNMKTMKVRSKSNDGINKIRLEFREETRSWIHDIGCFTFSKSTISQVVNSSRFNFEQYCGESTTPIPKLF